MRSSKETPKLPRHSGRHRVARLGSPTRRVLSTAVLPIKILVVCSGVTQFNTAANVQDQVLKKPIWPVLMPISFYDVLKTPVCMRTAIASKVCEGFL